MSKNVLFFIIFSTFLFSNGWDTPCLVPSEKVRIPDPNRVKTDFLTKELCTRHSGIYYNCYGSSEKLDTYIILDPVSEGSTNCNIRIVTEYFQYVDAVCIDTPFPAIDPNYNYSEQWIVGSSVEAGEISLCTQYNGTIENSTLSCNRYQRCKYVPPSSTDCLQSFQNTPYFSEYTTQGECETSLNTIQYPIVKYDITIDNVYKKTCCYADISTTDANSSSSDSSSGDNSSSNNSGGETSSTDGSSTENETSNTNNSNNNSSTTNDNNTSTTADNNTTNNNNITNDGSILSAINNSNVHLSQVNDNLGTVSGRIQVSGDKVYNEVKYQGDRSHDDTNNLITSINGNHDNLMLSVGNIETNLGYMHNQLTTMIDIMRNGSSSGDGTSPGTSSNQGDSNITINFDDSRIVEANNNTTKAVKDIFDFLKDGNISDEDLDFNNTLEDGNSSTWSDIMSRFGDALNDLNISKEDLENNIKTELEAQTADLQDKSQNLLTSTLDDLLDNFFNPLQPFIDAGQNINNFKTINIPINIDSEYIHVHKSLTFTVDQFYNSKTSLIFDVLKIVLQLIAVIAGMFYLIRGVTHA